MTDTKPTLPEPDTHCWDEDTQRDCWSYSEAQMRQYADAAVSAERERIAAALWATHLENASSHNYFGHIALLLREGKL